LCKRRKRGKIGNGIRPSEIVLISREDQTWEYTVKGRGELDLRILLGLMGKTYSSQRRKTEGEIHSPSG